MVPAGRLIVPESGMREFFERRWNRRLVFSGGSLLAVSCVLPLMLEFIEASGQRHAAQAAVAQTPELERGVQIQNTKLEEVRIELSTLRGLMVDETSVNQFRAGLVSLVRDSGCQLSNIVVEEAYERPWKVGTSLDRSDETFADNELGELPYVLQTRPVKIEVTGAFEGLKKFIASVNQMQQFKLTTSFRLRREDTLSIRLSWSMELFCIVEAPEPEWGRVGRRVVARFSIPAAFMSSSARVV